MGNGDRLAGRSPFVCPARYTACVESETQPLAPVVLSTGATFV